MYKIRHVLSSIIIAALISVAQASFSYTNTSEEEEWVYYWSQTETEVNNNLTYTTHHEGYESWEEEDGAGGSSTYTEYFDYYDSPQYDTSTVTNTQSPESHFVAVAPGATESHEDVFDAPTDFVDNTTSWVNSGNSSYSSGGLWVYYTWYDDITSREEGTIQTITRTNYW